MIMVYHGDNRPLFHGKFHGEFPRPEPTPMWWFHTCFYFYPDPWGDDPIWRAYFSNGLKPPTSDVIWCYADCLALRTSNIYMTQMRVGSGWFWRCVAMIDHFPETSAEGCPQRVTSLSMEGHCGSYHGNSRSSSEILRVQRVFLFENTACFFF